MSTWPSGGGVMAGLIGRYDWSTTPLGPIEQWPESLRTALNMVLAMVEPATLLWGPSHIQLYNDAYIAIAQDRHPVLLGRPASEGWPDAYDDVILPLLQAARDGRTTRLVGYGVALNNQNGEPEERFFDTDWVPVRDGAGVVAGVLQTLVEVTDYRRAEGALRNSETRHRLLVESWAQAVWETDAEGLVVEDSPSWRAYTGQTLEEWLGYGWLDAIHPDDRQYAERQWREAVTARALVNAEFRLRSPDGGWRWTNVRAAPVLDGSGGVEKWVGMNVDVDARKRAESALRRSEARLGALFESIDEGFSEMQVILDEDGHVVDWLHLALNRNFSRVTGIPDITGRLASEVFPNLEGEWFRRMDLAYRTGEPQRVEIELADLGRWFDNYITRVGGEDDELMLGVFGDITERKLAEQRLREREEKYRSVFEQMDEGLALCALVRDGEGRSVDYRYLELNPALARHGGFDREQLQGQRALEAFPNLDPWHLETYTRVVDSKEPVVAEHYYAHVDRWLRINAFPRGGDRFAVLYSDITERRRAEDALRESESRLAAAFESVPAGVAAIGTDGKVIIDNAEFRRFLPSGVVPSRDPQPLRWQAWDDEGNKLEPDDFPTARALRGERVTPGQEMLYTDETGRSIWTLVATAPTSDAEGKVSGTVTTISDIDERKRNVEALRQSERHANMLLAELQHRVRNTLAVVRSIARRTADNSESADEMLAHFQGRLDAFSRVQAALTRSVKGRVDLASLIEDELVAHASREGEQVRISGPEVLLQARDAERLSLAIHELTTNAVKHGALASTGGLIRVDWQIIDHGYDRREMLLKWVESGTAIDPSAIRREGFGMELLRRSLPYDLQAETHVELRPTGLRFELRMPLSATEI